MKFISAVLAILCTAGIAKSQHILTGRIVDGQTSEPLPGTTVVDIRSSQGTTADASGNFKLICSNPVDSILVSLIGYQPEYINPVQSDLIIRMQPSTASLNEVIVSANRDLQPRTEAPVAISVISRNTLTETKATQLEMVLNKVPGVYMVNLGNEQHSMSIRQPIGLKSLFLYLEDGIPIRTTGDFNHNALIEINHAALNRIEVIKGPGSSMYGSEAVGGALNFITQAPALFPTSRIQAEYGSNGYKRTDFSASSTVKKFGIFIGGYYAERNINDNEHNDFKKTAITLRADYSFSNKTRLNSSATLIRYKTDQVGGLDSAHFYGKDYKSFQRFTYRKVDALRIKISLLHDWNAKQRSSVTVYHRNSAIGQNPFYAIRNVQGNPLEARGEINDDAFTSYGSVLQHSIKLNFAAARIIGGISADISPLTYRAHFISIQRSAEGVYTNYTATDSLLTSYNADLLNTGAYLNFEITPFKNFKAVATARYDRLDYKFDNQLESSAFTGAPDEENKFEHFTPKLGFTYDLGNDRGIYANYSVGFAPPNITELYRGVKVPVLKPSTYSNYEAGGWFSFPGKNGYVEICGYVLEGTNEIVSVRLDDGSYENQNAGKTSHKGIEAAVRYDIGKGVLIRAGGTVAEHKYETYEERGILYSGKKMSQAPDMISNAEITYKPEFFKGFRISAEWQHLDEYYMDPANTKQYEGFDVFNLRAGYSIKGLEIWMNCMNITDEIYATSAEASAFGTSYRPGDLRTFNIGLGYTFTKR